jgi:isopentenyl-diphosphate Delta-isomerase
MNLEEFVVLVDANDNEIGKMEKYEAHRKGLLHRAFSVLIFNSKNELLLQQRAASKYHSPLLWTNSCCSHPRINESVLDAANRRLKEEMGLQTTLKVVDSFIYKAHLDKNMIEHEFDYVLIGKTDSLPKINREEVESYQYISLKNLIQLIENEPTNFTEWFKIIAPKISKYVNTRR